MYCLDVGLARAVSFKFSEDIGRILKNLVFTELKRRKKEIYFYKEQVECDFLIKEELNITQAIQVCLSLQDNKTSKREFLGLLEALEKYELNEGLILTYDEEDVKKIVHNNKQYKVKILPVWKWLINNDLVLETKN